MSSIFDENGEYKHAKEIIALIKKEYENSLMPSDTHEVINLDERSRRTRLATNWPGDDLATQLALDIAKVMTRYSILPSELRW